MRLDPNSLPDHIRRLNPGLFPGAGSVTPHATDVPAVSAEPGPKPARTRIRQSKKPLLNKLEAEWYHILKSTYPEDCPVFAQAIRVKLANGLWYKPDFVVFGFVIEGGTRIYAYEVKGPHAFRGGFENLKMAATVYREIKWFLVWKENGEWQEQEVLP